MKASFSSKAKVGLLIAASLTIAAAVVVSVGTRQKLFSRSVAYKTQFRSVAGLQPGSTVQLHGVRIGTVESVTLLPDVAAPKIEVEVSVEKRYAEHMRSDVRAQIKTIGVLGDKYVFLSSERDPKAVSLAPGGLIETVEVVDYDELIRQSEDILTNAAIITSSLRQLLLGIERGDSFIGKLVSDPEYGLDAVAAITKTFQNAESLTADMRGGKGLAGRLISDDVFAENLLRDVRAAAESANRLLASTEQGENLAGKLFANSEEGRRLFDNLATFSNALREIGESFEKDEGFLQALLTSSPESRDMVSNFHATLHRLASILDKLDRGEGSAGAFLNDPDLYQAVEDIVGVLDKKTMTKWYLRKKRKEGERARLREEEAGGKPVTVSPRPEDEPEIPPAPPDADPPKGEKAPSAAMPSAPEEIVVTAEPARDPFVEPAKPRRGK
jgi:phospholipid/cholesterol/gamma-HCH transport system substrate-binding protein